MQAPVYLVQVNEVLHSYWNAEILLIDVARNGPTNIKFFQSSNTFGGINYVPVTLEAIRKQYEQKKAS